MESLEADLERARDLDVETLADAIEAIGFECTRCGACCKAVDCGADAAASDDDAEAERPDEEADAHTATIFPDEIRQLQGEHDYDWRDVARPMPYGLTETADGPVGETFEWSLQTDDCGDCTFYTEADDGTGACTVHADRPLICRTYPFSVALGATSQPMGEAVDREGLVRAHECEGLGRDIDRADAADLASALKERAIRELEEAMAVRDNYRPVDPGPNEVVVHDSEGQKRPDGSGLSE